jgi:hypothetical protein
MRRRQQTGHGLEAAKVEDPVQSHGDGHIQRPDARRENPRPNEVGDAEQAILRERHASRSQRLPPSTPVRHAQRP